jgi:hypothetical protein
MRGGYPAIATAVDCLDKDRVIGGIAQCVAQTLDRTADPAVKIDKDVWRSEILPKLLPRHYFVRAAQQKAEVRKGNS